LASSRIRDNGFKLKEGGSTLEIRKKFFTVRVVRYWSRLTRELVDSPSLEACEARLRGALSNPTQWKVSLLMAWDIGTR